MPIYQYRCEECQKEVEWITLSPEVPHSMLCPDCRGSLTRVYTAPNLRFKGPGFHCNDYPKKGA